ncbi:LCP family protein [Actinoplanes utahensis]|uniref:Transcriptional regulator n=1 Tax=Actinoplanes utahensis TaxID=1869 RepID=A0A0A6XBF7_ACTUT|nr:LCP family protein [Actinoplanes utahensis]KHD77422.1 transcriptional regulator [Actinoplanes utahensis]GIF32801.1 hypothetical protein Aut01nite_57870 [Actinoplanes utahensis]
MRGSVRSGRPGRAPLWARIAIAVGSLLLIPSAVAAAVPAVTSRVLTLSGPLNLLLVGIDPRGAHTKPLADTIIVAHIPADRQGVYLFSLPRDLVVRIPAFPKSGSTAQRTKINAAMALGSRLPGGLRFDPARGYELLERTVRQVTGIPRFDAGAVLDFPGFKKLVTAMGGVTMTIDQTVVSEHHRPDGRPRDRLPRCQGDTKCLRPYTGPQKTYPQSDVPVRLSGWEALDFARQRYGLPRVDYDRQRHQRQMIRALARQVTRDVSTDPGRLPRVFGALGESLTFTGGGYGPLDWAVALKNLNLAKLTSITLPGGPLFENGRYLGEKLTPEARSFFAAVRADRASPFLLDHPAFVDRTP